jgi:hypothetical protein
MDEPLPGSVQDFIAQYVVSLEQLEILLLLSEAHERWFGPEDVFRIIRSNPSSIAHRLAGLRDDGLLAAEGEPARFRFAPKSETLRAAVVALRQCYHDRRVRIIEAIFRPRPDPAQSFADAFKIKKEK